MRIWHFSLLEFLPDNQLRGQWRECALIAYGIEKNGTPNHLLVNKITEYPIDNFWNYCNLVKLEMERRNFRVTMQSVERLSTIFFESYKKIAKDDIFKGWHTKEYLRSNMANLWEKHFMGIGKSRITDEEWQRLLDGYKEITGEDYKI